MPYADLNGWKVHYEAAGSGPPLILLHHWGGTGTLGWAPLVPLLARHFTVYVPDLRGHGQTGNPGLADVSPQSVAADALALAGALGLAPCHWAGFSFGGHALLWMALEAPEAMLSLATIGTPYALAPATRELMRRAGQAPDPKTVQQTAERHPAMGPEGWRWFAAQAVRQAEMHDGSDVDLGALGAVRFPCLVVNGDGDTFTPVEQAVALYRALPGARLLVLPGAGHSAHRTFPELTADWITRNALGR